MSTSIKTYRLRTCASCGQIDNVRTDNKAESCRSCSKKNSKNPNFGDVKFTGTITEYKRYHMRVTRKRGKASKCMNGCISSMYHWANISGKFEDINDYQEMCPKCHNKFDRKWGE
jgi:hypothetical protein